MTVTRRCSSSPDRLRNSSRVCRRLRGRMKSPSPASRLAATMPVTSTATVLAAATTSAPSPTAPASAIGDLRDGVPHRKRQLVGRSLRIVAIDLFLRPLGDRIEQRLRS